MLRKAAGMSVTARVLGIVLIAITWSAAAAASPAPSEACIGIVAFAEGNTNARDYTNNCGECIEFLPIIVGGNGQTIPGSNGPTLSRGTTTVRLLSGQKQRVFFDWIEGTWTGRAQAVRSCGSTGPQAPLRSPPNIAAPTTEQEERRKQTRIFGEALKLVIAGNSPFLQQDFQQDLEGRIDLENPDEIGYYLGVAANNCAKRSVDVLLSHDPELNYRVHQPISQSIFNPPIYYAVRMERPGVCSQLDQIYIVQRILEAGTSFIDQQHLVGLAYFDWVAGCGPLSRTSAPYKRPDKDIAELLIAFGADITFQYPGSKGTVFHTISTYVDSEYCISMLEFYLSKLTSPGILESRDSFNMRPIDRARYSATYRNSQCLDFQTSEERLLKNRVEQILLRAGSKPSNRPPGPVRCP
jgi:hypothetical protein